jgi:hypothetical protein
VVKPETEDGVHKIVFTGDGIKMLENVSDFPLARNLAVTEENHLPAGILTRERGFP